MPRAPSLSDEEILARLTEVFRTHGYEGTSLSIISKATGLVRASLYHRFPGGKEEMAERVMKRARAWLEGEALAPLKDASLTPEERARAMTEYLDAFYASGSKSCLLDALSLGAGETPLRGLAQKTMESWATRLAELGMEAGLEATEAARRAEEAIVLIQGALVVARVQDDPAPFRRVLSELPERLVGN